MKNSHLDGFEIISLIWFESVFSVSGEKKYCLKVIGSVWKLISATE